MVATTYPPADAEYGSAVTRHVPATIDDLRKACEAVGLHVVEHSFATTVAKAKAIESEVATLRAQLAAAEAKAWSERDGRMALAEAYRKRAEKCCLDLGTMQTERDTARAQLAALTSGEVRATDGDLLAMAGDAYRLRSREDATLDDLRKLAVDVAARVRRERGACLVERLVAKGFYVYICPDTEGRWDIECARPSKAALEKPSMTHVDAAEVPATLARLAGLDGGT